jgi:hypothetical protein
MIKLMALNTEIKNIYGFAVIKSDGSSGCLGSRMRRPRHSLDGTVHATARFTPSGSNFVALRTDGALAPLGNQKY